MIQFDELIAQEEVLLAQKAARIAEIRAFRKSLEDKELAAMARQYLAMQPLGEDATEATRRPQKQRPNAVTTGGVPDATNESLKKIPSLDRMKALFSSQDNIPLSISDIAVGSNMSPANVRRIIYKAHCALFEKAGRNAATREVLFRML